MKILSLNRLGFTMIEVAMATMIMALGIVPVYHLMTSGTRGVEIGEREVLAVGHTSSIIEFFKGLPYNLVINLCENGILTGKQKGFMSYNRVEHKMQNKGNLDNSKWELSESSNTGSMFFEQVLNPDMPTKKKLHLPPLEKFFTREVNIDCNSNNDRFCIVMAKTTWKTSDGRDRFFLLKTVVTGK
ncbi:MAG: hypothetical protein COB02_07795 [Candidatus Cloacimonadota bacterium]|nr:MAG: hypothetical protein COB02_07795 [Candidatus Cloacimonadota bacterium]